MNRRKFLIASGAIATGGAAAVGSGAFTSVEAGRDVEVNVAGDAAAVLGIEPVPGPNDEYVDVSAGQFAFAVTGTDSDGNGVNLNALTRIDDIVRITNQGTQSIVFGARFTAGGFSNRNVLFVDESDVQASSSPALPFDDIVVVTVGVTDEFAWGDHPTAVALAPGDAIELGYLVDTREHGTTGTETNVAVLHAYSEQDAFETAIGGSGWTTAGLRP
jgi:hypothetical protein